MRSALVRCALVLCLVPLACIGETSDPAHDEVDPGLPPVLGEDLEPGDWTVPVPRGTKIIDSAPVSNESRSTRGVELVKDLEIGEKNGDPQALFYKARDLAVDHRGWIYVADMGNHRVQVFNSTGEYVRTIGREGQGPAEFSAALSVEIVGEHLVVSDPNLRRMNVWTLEGVHVRTYSVPSDIQYMFAVSDDALVVRYSLWYQGLGSHDVAYARFDLTGHEVLRYAILAAPEAAPTITRSSGGAVVRAVLPVGTPLPWATASPRGHMYMTAGDEYQVLALTDLGEPRWALRAESARQPVEPSEIKLALELYRPPFTDAEIAGVTWPELQPALSRGRMPGEPGHSLQIDGHGHLYVFPYISAPWVSDDRMRPVDVYSEDGDLLFFGLMPTCNWMAALGDHVYALENDVETDNQVVVRYRLVEPF